METYHNLLRHRHEENFVPFYNQWYASLCYFANRYTSDPLLAEDLVSEVALKVWEKRGTLKNEAALKSYFYTSLRNACIDHLAKEKTSEKRKERYARSISTEEAPFTEEMIRTETLRQLEAAIDSLPGQCRTVFTKLFTEGKTLSEAADEMGLSIFTVKAQRQRGMKLLRERMTITPLLMLLIASFFCR
jgi:RNA polymerase sigma-70 factor (ECF subfamily)